MKLYVRKLTVEHYISVKDIFTQQFNYNDISLGDLYLSWKYKSNDHSLGVFTRDGDLLGFALVQDNYTSFIAVHSSYQGGNVGSSLITNILKKCIRDNRSMYLYPLQQRHKLIKWYGSYGFHKTHDGYLAFHCHNTRRQGPFLRKLIT
jgi:ribosomal protein S18 acetylase RimI-like enzyme